MGGNNGGNNPDKEEAPAINWVPTLEQTLMQVKGSDKYILLYVYPPTEMADPAAFKIKEILDASNGNWAFTKRPFEKDNAELKELKVGSAPIIIGMDRHGNEFKRTSTVSGGAIKAILEETPAAVVKFKNDLATRWKSAVAAADEAAALKIMVAIIGLGKKGYTEIEDSFSKVREYGDKRLQGIEALATSDDAAALKGLEQMLVDFKGTPPAADAEIKLAQREKETKTASAIARLLKVIAIAGDHWKVQREAAQKQLDEMIADGLARVETAVKAADAGEVDAARKSLSKLINDFKGTEVAKKASEAMKGIDKK